MTLLGIAALLVALVPQISPAEDVKPEDKLLTRYFWIPSSLFPAVEESEDKWPLILDGLEDDEATQTNNARKFLDAVGVAFPPGAAAVYYNHASLLGVKNTAENIRKVAEIIKVDYGEESKMLSIEVRVVEYTPDVEAKLGGRCTFAELEVKLGASVKTVCVSSVITKSGQRATGRLDSGSAKTNAAPKQNVKTKPAVEESEAWPPSAGVQRALLEVEPTLMARKEEADMQILFRYAAPAGSGQPTMRTEVSTNFSIKDGCLLVLKTFTVSDSANTRPDPRRYAVVVGFNIENAEGKTMEKVREEIAEKLKKMKKP